MPSEKAHLLLAEHNRKLIRHLLPEIGQFPDWITTVAFYRALHLIEAVFAGDPDVRHGRTHEERERLLKTSKRYSHIYKHYRLLWTASIIARYLEDNEEQRSSFSDYLAAKDVEEKILKHYLRQVEGSVEGLLGRAIPRWHDPSPEKA